MTPGLYVGTSGFSYDFWRGSFYPAQLPTSERLMFYASKFNSVELNGTFYRMPDPAQLGRWAAGVPEGFRFSLKAHRGLTYSAAGFDKAGFAYEFADRAAVLGSHQGPVLVQFPPTKVADPGLLRAVLEPLGSRAAVEFRHPSWFASDVLARLEDLGSALVVTDQERWPRAPLLDLGSFRYFRLRREYSEPELSDWAATIRAELARSDEVYVYFRHLPQAPQLALRLRELVAVPAAGSARGS